MHQAFEGPKDRCSWIFWGVELKTAGLGINVFAPQHPSCWALPRWTLGGGHGSI